MSTESNKSVVMTYVEAFNAGRFEDLRSIFTDDALIHGVTGSATLDLAIPFWKQLHDSLEAKLDVEEIVAEGDKVVVRYTERGRWVGPWMGRDNPSGKTFELSAMEWFVLQDGKIRRRWGARDSASQARQIGL